jgi:NADH-ubiquinone oxidoreductase chain 4L
MLLAVNLNFFLVFSVLLDDMVSQSFASLVPTVTAAESAIRLAIFVITFRVEVTWSRVNFIKVYQFLARAWPTSSTKKARRMQRERVPSCLVDGIGCHV